MQPAEYTNSHQGCVVQVGICVFVKIYKFPLEACIPGAYLRFELVCFGVKIKFFVYFGVKNLELVCFWCQLKMVLVSTKRQISRMESPGFQFQAPSHSFLCIGS